MKNKNGLFTIIFMSYYSKNRINSVYHILKERFKKENIDFEFIVMDDGSKDNSYDIALELEKNQNNVRAYQLSKNYTNSYSKFAGFSVSRGDLVTTIPDDWQQPLDTYIQMYREWQNGAKIIIPHRKARKDSFFGDMFSRAYYNFMNKTSEVHFPPGGCDVFAADREVIDIIVKRISPINTYLTVEVLRLGFDPVFLPFDRPSVDNKSRWTFKKKIKLATNSFFASSSFPIRFISLIGVFTFFISMFLIILVVILKLFGSGGLGGFVIPGWATTIVFISLFSGLILLSLGVIAEYIWRIYEEVKNRPAYIIKKKEDLD